MHSVRVGLTAVQQKTQLQQDVAKQWAKANGDEDFSLAVSDDDISWATVAHVPCDISTEFFGDSVGTVIRWLRGLTSSPDSELQWVTTYQLLVDFQVQSGQNGVKYIDKRWCPISDWEVSNDYEFTKVAQLFGAYLRSLAKKLDQVCVLKPRRPTSSSFSRWNKCFFMQISKRRMSEVDLLWQKRGIVPIKLVTAAFKGQHFIDRFQST